MILKNEIRLLVELDEEPIDEDKQTIESLLKSTLLEIYPAAEIKVEIGYGSWIIVVWATLEKLGGWLIPEFGSWLAGKGFDWIQNRIGHPKYLPIAKEPESLLVRKQEKDPMRESDFPGVLESPQANNQSEALLKLANQMATLAKDPAFLDSGKVTIKFAEWSSSLNLGVCVSLTKVKDEKNEAESEFLVDLTHSKEDFNSRFNF